MSREDVQALVCLVVLAALCAVVIVALVFIARALADVAGSMRKVHIQQANIIRMLLKAGFRPARHGRDWFDDGAPTQVIGQGSDYDTQFDMSRPPRA